MISNGTVVGKKLENIVNRSCSSCGMCCMDKLDTWAYNNIITGFLIDNDFIKNVSERVDKAIKDIRNNKQVFFDLFGINRRNRLNGLNRFSGFLNKIYNMEKDEKLLNIRYIKDNINNFVLSSNVVGVNNNACSFYSENQGCMVEEFKPDICDSYICKDLRYNIINNIHNYVDGFIKHIDKDRLKEIIKTRIGIIKRDLYLSRKITVVGGDNSLYNELKDIFGEKYSREMIGLVKSVNLSELKNVLDDYHVLITGNIVKDKQEEIFDLMRFTYIYRLK